MSIRTTYNSDSDNLFDITWHRPISARDALTQCLTNASIAAFLCIIYLGSCVMFCWEYRPECKTENEIGAKQHLEQCKREEKPRLWAEIKLAPVLLPLKRSLLELQLRGHWPSYSAILLGHPTRCAYSECLLGVSTRGVALPVSNKALGQ